MAKIQAKPAKPETTMVQVTGFPVDALARLREHARRAGHNSNAGALRWAGLELLARLDLGAAGKRPAI